jgi:hypothetical protein
MNNIYWEYYLSIEADIKRLKRYIEFDKKNLKCFSLNNASLLMTSTQEADVILKEIIKIESKRSLDSERKYRDYFLSSGLKKHVRLLNIKTKINHSDLEFTPFENWLYNKTPIWWTANNKIKHKRTEKFDLANLENVLNSISALFILNVYYIEMCSPDKQFIQPSNLVLSNNIRTTMMNGNGEFLFKYKLL